MNDLTDVATINRLMEIGATKFQKVEVEGRNYLIIPSGCELKDFEQYLDNPRKIMAAPIFTGVESFIDYFNRYSNEHSTIFIERGLNGDIGERMEPRMHAILDYHEETLKPKFGSHEGYLQLRLSDEFKTWNHINDKFRDQQNFAEFIEDHSQCFIKPESARMIEIALSLRAKTDVEFENQRQLHNGTQTIKFKETMKATAGETGEIVIPENIEVAIKIFEGITEVDPDDSDKRKSLRYKVDGKFRFQIRATELNLKFKLLNLQIVYDHAVDKLGDYVRERIDRGHVYEGSK